MASPAASVCLVDGFFAFTGGRRITMPKHSTAGRINVTNTYYHIYQTTLQCTLDNYLPAEARIYSPPGSAALPDDTIVKLLARMYTSPTGSLLDIISMAPVPGDPQAFDYDRGLPDDRYPHVTLLGAVVGEGEELGDSARAFSVRVSAHVWNERRVSEIKYVQYFAPTQLSC